MTSIATLKAQYPSMSGVTMRSRLGGADYEREMERLRVSPYLSTTEAEFYTGLGLKSLLKLREEGNVHAVQVKRNWHWETESIQTMGRNAA
jgi:hypothetical protein